MGKKKLIDEIKDFVVEKNDRWPEMVIEKQGPVEQGWFFIVNNKGFRFGVVLQDYSELKITFFFFEGFSDDEFDYWDARYKFKMFTDQGKSYNVALSIINIKEEISNFPVKVIMSRFISNPVPFKNDFKWIINMGRLRMPEVKE